MLKIFLEPFSTQGYRILAFQVEDMISVRIEALDNDGDLPF
jgi:hypothetical protein